MVFVRKYSPAKWGEDDFFSNKSDIKADAITGGLRTTDNALSLWKIESSQDEDKINDIALHLICKQDKFTPLYFLLIDLEKLSGCDLNCKHRPINVKQVGGLHYQINKLTEKKLIKFAEIMRDIHRSNADKQKFIKPSVLKERFANEVISNNIKLDDYKNKSKSYLSCIIKKILSLNTDIRQNKYKEILNQILDNYKDESVSIDKRLSSYI